MSLPATYSLEWEMLKPSTKDSTRHSALSAEIQSGMPTLNAKTFTTEDARIRVVGTERWQSNELRSFAPLDSRGRLSLRVYGYPASREE